MNIRPCVQPLSMQLVIPASGMAAFSMTLWLTNIEIHFPRRPPRETPEVCLHASVVGALAFSVCEEVILHTGFVVNRDPILVHLPRPASQMLARGIRTQGSSQLAKLKGSWEAVSLPPAVDSASRQGNHFFSP